MALFLIHLKKFFWRFPERNMIKQWLQAGVLEHGNYIPSVAGTPQGGIISRKQSGKLLVDVFSDPASRLKAFP
ncbi:hypothetical protein [Candidatus Hamiltonella defensa]|uniref:hypothetical protein n=1 Tax=Candidatus Williamhamiltonella defendens TaxID=138072 RepID=UPI0015839689|nr:hypothetical protein [Candidatus Hamiltonella defensa]